jgi:methionine-rich copper-binding protein CopC
MALSDLPAIANNTILGNNSGSSASPSALTVTQILAMLNAYRAGQNAIGIGTNSLNVTFSSTLGTSNYALICNMHNSADTYVQYQPIVVTSQGATGFSVTWDAVVSTSNYYLNWQAIVSDSYRAGQNVIGIGTTSLSVTFSSSLSASNYALSCNMYNSTDTYVQYQPVIVTAQSATGFTVTWDAAVLTGNYSLNWQATLPF